MKAYKVFNPDWTCKGFKYKVGKTYTHKGGIKLCVSGFHACQKIADCFNYYVFNPENKVAEVELVGKVLGEDQDKQVTDKIKIIKELSWNEVLDLVNTGKGNSGYSNSGDRNSGYRNSGDRNSGYRNSGDRNSGYRNSGYSNSGDSNSGDSNSGNRNSGYSNSGDRNSGYRNSGNYNTGHFNTTTPEKISVFNKPCLRSKWDSAKKPNFIYFNLTEWVWWSDMSEEEKKNNKDAFVTDGYLKTYDYKEAWRRSYEKATDDDIRLLKALPNFNKKVFEEITGIKIK
jgi:hypothetical protein